MGSGEEMGWGGMESTRMHERNGHDDPRRYGAQTSNLWSTRVLGVRLLLRGVACVTARGIRLLPAAATLRCRYRPAAVAASAAAAWPRKAMMILVGTGRRLQICGAREC